MTTSDAARQSESGIAIIGMSCRFPGAPSVDAFWHNILSKVDAVSDPPPEAWDSDVYYDPSFADTDKVYCRRGGYLGDLARFDPLAHGIPPVSVGGEPDQWLALQLAFEAMADANCQNLPEEVRRRTSIILGKGTYLNGGNAIAVERTLIVGQTLEIIRHLMPELSPGQIELLRSEMKKVLPSVGPETVPGLVSNIMVGRIANRLDLMGPAYTLDAACASSLLAVQHGVRALRSGEADLILAGGSQVWISIPILNVFSHLGALSRQQRIKPFDADADGTLLGEGIAMVVLKRLGDAERDGDRIYAVIRGTGVASDGRGVGVMAPRVEGEELALRRAYADAGVSPGSIGLIEAHGTATPVGDVAEVQALTRVFGKRDGGLPYCGLGTVKSMISHTIPAAGAAGIIKTALALHHKVLPPTINCDQPNPKLELESSPFYINTETRPWIHGGPEPRRAGVNAFGFGGINAHVVLEEYVRPEPANRTEPDDLTPTAISLPGHATGWDSEVFILEAATAGELLAEARLFLSVVEPVAELERSEHGAESPFNLADLAHSLMLEIGNLNDSLRLAIVADSFDDLRTKLGRAISRLEDPSCKRIKDVKGIYYSAEPLARQGPAGGKVAFLFPGEGSQYPNMLADLCLHFPEVRRWFDQNDRIYSGHSRGYLTSDYVYPRPVFSEDDRRRDERRLMDMDLAIESVLTANQAILSLMHGLGLRPDVCLGHSTGEYSALFAAGVLGLETEAEIAEFSRELNGLYEEAVAESRVPRAMMLAIAADREQVSAIARQAGGDVYLAMDNCPHQAVLVGPIADVERARDLAQQAGLIYEQLTFDRAYHTPLFAPYADQMRSAAEHTPIQPAQIPVFSCTTGLAYPDDPEDVRELMVEHWTSPVEFQATIERLYQDGVRIFVEVGPRGNLSAFVEDILRGRPMAAIPANVQRRSGISQLNHLVAMLITNGIELDLSYLTHRRRVRKVNWREGLCSDSPARSHEMPLSISWPMLRLPDEAYQRVRALSTPATGADAQRFAKSSPGGPDGNASTTPLPIPGEGIRDEGGHETAMPAIAPNDYAGEYVPIVDRSPDPLGSRVAIDEYLDTMDHFLEIQREVMGRYLGAAAQEEAGCLSEEVDPERSIRSRFPLLGEVIAESPGEALIARRAFDPSEDRYLLDHTLGRSVSILDPDLHAMAFMPLTMSLEILAEAAARLVPELLVAGFRAVNARRWILWEDEPRTLEVEARLVSADDRNTQVKVWLRDLGIPGGETQNDDSAVAEAIVLLSDGYPSAPHSPLVGPINGNPSRLPVERLYADIMFHGPSWQGVVSIDQTGDSSSSATLRTLPFDGFFASNPDPWFEIDPAILDAAGQTIGFWSAEKMSGSPVTFPFGVEAVNFFTPPMAAGYEMTCRANIGGIGEKRMRSTIELLDDRDTPLIQLIGWQNQHFDLPSALEPLVFNVNAGLMSTLWPDANALLDGDLPAEARRCSAILGADREFWKRVWYTRVLSRRERERYQRLRLPENRRLEWLAARTAAKDAVVQLINARYGLALRPADVEIEQDENGQPLIAGDWLGWIDTQPLVSLSHSDGEAVALVMLVEPGSPVRFGVDIERMRDRPAGMAEFAFSEPEQQFLATLSMASLPEWEIRLWCAKEAAAKAIGLGLIDGPGSIELVSVDAERNDLRFRPSEALGRRFPELAAVSLKARTGRQGDLVFAIARTAR